MTIYVDNPNYRYQRMIMCHMIADTEEELHEMAEKLGLKREWFQNHSGRPHYDICKKKRKIALSLGAEEIDSRTMIRILRGVKK